MLFREVLLSARLKDYELEIPLTDEQSVPRPSLSPLSSCAGAGAREDWPCCGWGASGAVNCRFVPPSQLHNFCKGRGVQLHLKEKKDFGPVRS